MGFALTNMPVRSSAFADQGAIPKRHTQEGEDVSPALEWSNPPEGTKGYAVFCHDPDAPLVTPDGNYGFVHWVLYNIPGSVTSLAEGTGEYTVGKNDTGGSGYNGPMPPEGHGVHHYFYYVLALDQETSLPEGLSLYEMLAKLEPHILGLNRIVGTYQRG